MVPLLQCIFDYESSPETYERYDRMTARELFVRYGVSQRLYEGFLKPLLLVGMFAPPEELSAASMLDTFYFYSESYNISHLNESSCDHVPILCSRVTCDESSVTGH